MKYIEKWLNTMTDLQPIPTAVEPRLDKIEGIKAIIFDIYGTLVVSASGDINQIDLSQENMRTALKEADYLLQEKDPKKGEKVVAELLQQFVDILQKHQQQLRDSGTPFPEADIRQVWDEWLQYAIGKKYITTNGASDITHLTFVFEMLSNKIHPMPGMLEVLHYFHDRKYPMGIVSNAQFYTPVMMNFFIDGQARDTESLPLFNDDITQFSYSLRKAKPDRTLFAPVLKALKENYGIAPHESVFVGNDMYNDIYPAQDLGMKTVFFAGDKRALRLREDKAEVKNVRPDAVITELLQLTRIIL
ncbi:HAD family hydrolase [Candidatus Falkowbacteria bacterium]|jgi:putative hydrolase of the HAD superfamily|nr:HAD family hydrolase [Candidatus Falkowbacteria bacterium]